MTNEDGVERRSTYHNEAEVDEGLAHNDDEGGGRFQMRSESVGGVERFVAFSLRHLSSSRDKSLSQRLPIGVSLARDLVLII